jgi:hypothetical protein
VSAEHLLHDLVRRGVELRADGDRVRWRAPRGVIGPADVEAIRSHKPALISLMSRPSLIDDAYALEARDLRGVNRVLVRAWNPRAAQPDGVGAVRARVHTDLPCFWVAYEPAAFHALLAEEARRATTNRRCVLWATDFWFIADRPFDCWRAVLANATADPQWRVQ